MVVEEEDKIALDPRTVTLQELKRIARVRGESLLDPPEESNEGLERARALNWLGKRGVIRFRSKSDKPEKDTKANKT